MTTLKESAATYGVDQTVNRSIRVLLEAAYLAGAKAALEMASRKCIAGANHWRELEPPENNSDVVIKARENCAVVCETLARNILHLIPE